MILRFLTVIGFIFINTTSVLYAQLGSVRVTLYGGGNVNFIFNTIAEYKSGITYTNWTVLGIGVTEPAANFNGWNLSVSAEDANSDGNLNGSIAANTIPLSDLQVQATSIKTCAPVPCPISLLGSPWVNLVGFSFGPTIIANSTSDANCPCPPGILTTVLPSTSQINISYRCGVVPLGSMMGRPADIYSDNIFFDIAFF